MSNQSGNYSGTTSNAANYGARMGAPDTRSNPEPKAVARQDNMQHAHPGSSAGAGTDPMALRRALLVSGMAGQAARAGK